MHGNMKGQTSRSRFALAAVAAIGGAFAAGEDADAVIPPPVCMEYATPPDHDAAPPNDQCGSVTGYLSQESTSQEGSSPLYRLATTKYQGVCDPVTKSCGCQVGPNGNTLFGCDNCGAKNMVTEGVCFIHMHCAYTDQTPPLPPALPLPPCHLCTALRLPQPFD